MASKVEILLMIWALLWSAAPTAAQEDLPREIVNYADTVLYNGKVLTADDRFTMAEAVAIRAGKFLAVGDTDKILKMAGPETRKIDLGGKTVVPGFINSHLHLAEQHQTERWDRGTEGKIDKAGSLKQATLVLEAVRREAVANPGKWVVKYYSGRFREAVLEGLLTKEKLDEVAPNTPVALGYMTDSFWLLNSEGLQRADFTPDISGVSRDEKTGKPNGIAQGDAGYAIAYEIGSWAVPVATQAALIKAATKLVNAQGTTTIHTRVSSHGMTALRNMLADDELTLRWRVALTGARATEAFSEKFFARLGNLSGIGNDVLKIVGFAPGGVDGSPDAGRAWTWTPKLRVMLGSYTDPTGYVEPIAQATLKNVRIAAKYGWNVVGIHSIGDRSTSEAMAAYENGRAESVVGHRSDQWLRVDHLMIVRPEDLAKMKALNVVPSVAAWHMFVPAKNMVYQYGADGVNRMVRGRSFIEAGLKPVGENSSYHPLWNIERMVTRTDRDGRIWGAHEKVNRREALWMQTNWVAHYVGDSKSLGTIEPGKLADLAIIDGDYMSVPENEISKLQVVTTILGGQVVYDKERDGFVAPVSWDVEKDVR